MRILFRQLFLLLLLTEQVFAQDTLVVSDQLNQQYLGKYAYTLQDVNRKYGISQLLDSPQLFTKSNNSVINFGVTDNNNWVKLYLKNNSNLSKIILNIPYPIIDTVTFYTVHSKLIDSVKIIDKDPISSRKYKHPFYIFEVAIPRDSTVTCFFKLNSNKQIIVPVKLENTETVVVALVNSDTLSGLYIGIMIAMMLYNLFVYFSSRDGHYLYYCNYVFWVSLTQAVLLGLLHRFTFINYAPVASRLLTFVGAMSGIATVLFVKSFLRVKFHAPRYVYFLNAIIIGDILAILLLFVGRPINAYNVVNATAGLGSLIVVAVALNVYKKDYKPARYFLFGWVFFLGGIIVFVLKDIGILPYNIFTIRSVQIGSVLEAMLLSFALADKLNILKKEKEASQLEALAAAQENERIIKEQNEILEFKVEERTHELLETNDALNLTLENLKQAQGQLVESEKMASLGQLTAGIAHEINNPINFVTSNVTPLRRDVDMLLDALNNIELIGLSDLPVADKRKKINEYKEDLDFDYLKEEVEHLLKGIYEGASRTAEIVKGLRIFSRVDEDDLKRADMNEGLDSTIVIINNLLDNRIEVIKHYEQLPPIECYPGKLNQVFLNIISNAIHAINQKFGEQPGGKITITTSSTEHDVIIKIKDNGTGMDDKTKQKIFEPFFTTKEVGEGTGLGMSIAYNTIKKHNGQILIESKIGEGTEFVLKLPKIYVVPAI